MSIETVREYLKTWGRDGDILEMPTSTATVQLAAEALGTQPERIAKTLSLSDGSGGAIVVVTAGDARIHNGSFKARFGHKPKMLSAEEVPLLTGHGIGGVCPFALPEGTPVWLDESLRRFETVYPACGSANSAIELTLPELEQYAGALGWVAVTSF